MFRDDSSKRVQSSHHRALFAQCDLHESDFPNSGDLSWVATFKNPDLQKIARKALFGERLTLQEGSALMRFPEEDLICQLADRVRRQKVGNSVLYATTLFVHPTNLCELSCPMCSYYAKPGQAKAWFHSPSKILDDVRAHLDLGINEVHIVGGLWREANLDYYQAIFQGIKLLSSHLHIKALTPVEFDFLAQLHNLSVHEVLRRMKSWGLGSIPGGGAEVLVENIRRQIAPQKISSDRYLEIHAEAHALGLPSNVTMLFGHVEESEDLVIHLDRVRRLQDLTGGFGAFVPLKYHVENNALGTRSKRLKAKSIHRVYALARLMLDNFDTIKVLWNYVGLAQAQEILRCGANDLGSTALGEKIAIAAGGIRLAMDQNGMRRAIGQVGRRPQLAHSGADLTSLWRSSKGDL